MSRTKRRIPYWVKQGGVYLRNGKLAEKSEFLNGYDKLSRRTTDQKIWDENDGTDRSHKIRVHGKRFVSMMKDKIEVEDEF